VYIKVEEDTSSLQSIFFVPVSFGKSSSQDMPDGAPLGIGTQDMDFLFNRGGFRFKSEFIAQLVECLTPEVVGSSPTRGQSMSKNSVVQLAEHRLIFYTKVFSLRFQHLAEANENE
jgi:hypothetical protein